MRKNKPIWLLSIICLMFCLILFLIVDNINNLTKILIKHGKFNIAEILIEKNLYSGFKPVNKISFYISQGKYEKAQNIFYLYEQNNMFSLPVMIYYRKYKEQNIANIYEQLGVINIYLKNYQKAENYFLDAIKIKEPLLNKTLRHKPDMQELEIDFDYNLLAMLELERNNLVSAKKYIDKAENIIKTSDKYRKNDNSLLYLTNYNLSNYYAQKDEYDKAINVAKELFIYIPKEFLPTKIPEYKQLKYSSLAYKNMGNIYSKIGDYNNALYFYEQALILDNAIHKNNSPNSVCTQFYIAEIYKKINNSDNYKYIDMKQDILLKNKNFLAFKNLSYKDRYDLMNDFCISNIRSEVIW